MTPAHNPEPQARYEPEEGDYLAVRRGHVHIARGTSPYPTYVRVACGTLYRLVDVTHASEERALARPCHRCWDAM